MTEPDELFQSESKTARANSVEYGHLSGSEGESKTAPRIPLSDKSTSEAESQTPNTTPCVAKFDEEVKDDLRHHAAGGIKEVLFIMADTYIGAKRNRRQNARSDFCQFNFARLTLHENGL